MTGITLVLILLAFSSLFTIQLFFDKWQLKLATITFLFVISSGVYFSFETYKGWPTNEKVDSGYLLSSLIINPSAVDPGSIYFWVVGKEEPKLTYVQSIFTYTFEFLNSPRSYRIPYSEEAAEKFAMAQQKLLEGYIVEMGPGASEGQEGAEEGDGKIKGFGDKEDYEVPHLEIISPEQLMRK